VYGGGSIGLMGLVSQAVHRGGGKVLGYKQSILCFHFFGFLIYIKICCLCFQIAYAIIIFWILVHRIIPRTLMGKEVHNLNLLWVLFSSSFCL
jgi:hypothetical protein